MPGRSSYGGWACFYTHFSGYNKAESQIRHEDVKLADVYSSGLRSNHVTRQVSFKK